MNRYEVQIPSLKKSLGEYEGNTPEEAIEAMRKSRGFYSSYYIVSATLLNEGQAAEESAPQYKDAHERADNYDRDSRKMRANMSREAYRAFNHEDD